MLCPIVQASFFIPILYKVTGIEFHSGSFQAYLPLIWGSLNFQEVVPFKMCAFTGTVYSASSSINGNWLSTEILKAEGARENKFE